MDRTVPTIGSEDIELYMRTYYSLLRSTHSIQIETLVESHFAMDSSLHVLARMEQPDISALIYSSLRLPAHMPQVDHVALGQIEKAFRDNDYDIDKWARVSAPGRRRRMHFDHQHQLAVFIASRSDIDDILPMLTAYQIEWNKLNALLQGEVARLFLNQHVERRTRLSDGEMDVMANALQVEAADLRRLEVVWGDKFVSTLHAIAAGRKSISLRLLAGSQAAYRRATASWWSEVQSQLGDKIDLEQRPVYFISSNTHAIVNLLTGFARREEESIIHYIRTRGHEGLLNEYESIQQNDGATRNLDNFLYYVLKKYLADTGRDTQEQMRVDESEIGIYRVASRHGFEIETQIIDVSRIRTQWLDPRLVDLVDSERMANSNALIVNIDYPLGLAAYEILSRVTEHVDSLLGVYVMGKAATLNARVGDVMLPNVVHDEHSKNTYLFHNCFNASDVAPYLTYGTVLDNQKSISALGTFLQNTRYMSVFYHEGYTDIEMEAGPYLSSIYEAVRPQRHPQNEIVNLYTAPFDIGFLHYASDRPLGKGHNLGTSNLSYAGVEPTYATAVAILRRIFSREHTRLQAQQERTQQPVLP